MQKVSAKYSLIVNCIRDARHPNFPNTFNIRCPKISYIIISRYYKAHIYYHDYNIDGPPTRFARGAADLFSRFAWGAADLICIYI